MSDHDVDFATRVREDSRLAILERLHRQPDYTAHEHLLREALEAVGQRLSADRLRDHLAWLDEQGLLVLSGGAIRIATLTLRGEDAARGLARVPGVARPRPGRAE